MHSHLAREPVPLHELGHDIPHAVSAIVMKLMAKMPEQLLLVAGHPGIGKSALIRELGTLTGGTGHFVQGKYDLLWSVVPRPPNALRCRCGQLYLGPRMHCDLLWSVVPRPPNALRSAVVSGLRPRQGTRVADAPTSPTPQSVAMSAAHGLAAALSIASGSSPLDRRFIGLPICQPLARNAATLPFITAAETLEAQLFPDGLSFLLLKYRSEWFESKKRIELIDQEGLGAHFNTLGGAVILDSLRAAQRAYGDALGLTAHTDGDVTLVRDALSAFQAELRRYVISVVAHIDPDDDATQALANTLLAPLVEWKSSAARQTDAESEEPAEEPSDEDAAEPDPAEEPADD